MFDVLKILKTTAVGLSILALGVVSGQKIALKQAKEFLDKDNIIIDATIDYFTYIKGINMLSSADIADELNRYYIIDLRNPKDYTQEHIVGAVNILMPQIGKAIPTFPKDKPLLLVCYSGEWALQAAGVLRLAGYDARVLEGGYNSWEIEMGEKKSDN